MEYEWKESNLITFVLQRKAKTLQHEADVVAILVAFVDHGQKEYLAILLLTIPQTNDELVHASVCTHHKLRDLAICPSETNSCEELVEAGNLGHGALVLIALVVLAGDCVADMMDSKFLADLRDSIERSLLEDAWVLVFEDSHEAFDGAGNNIMIL